jgi:hypothetical protein
MTTAALLPMANGIIGAIGFPLSVMTTAIKGLYGVAGKIDDFIDDHITQMKESDNTTIATTGRVIEAAKFGFGIGYVAPVVIIAVGQFLLGNTLSAVMTVATAATLSNPIAMTCAAFGAIYYGWGALSDTERQEILDKISEGLQIGVELIKAVVRFVVDKTKELMSSKNIEEFKKFIGSAAGVFGKTLGDVTHKITDVFSGTYDGFKKKSGETFEKSIEVAAGTYKTVSESAEKAAGSIRDRLGKPTTKNDGGVDHEITQPSQNGQSEEK